MRATAAGVAARYTDANTLTAWVEPRTGRVLDLRWNEIVKATITDPVVGTVPLDEPVKAADRVLPTADVAASAASARSAPEPRWITTRHSSRWLGRSASWP